MIYDFLVQIKKIAGTLTPIEKPKDTLLSALKFIMLFSAFYFAIFKFGVPKDRIYRALLEYIYVGFSLFCSLLIFGIAKELFFKIFQKKLIPKFGYTPIAFLITYSLMIAILFFIRNSIYSIEKNWIWKYYWRHFLYGILIYLVFLYRDYKNSVVNNLVERLNIGIKKSDQQDVDVGDHLKNEVYLVFNVDGVPQKILPSTITHLTVNGHYLDIYYQKRDTLYQFSVRKSMKEMIEELPAKQFLKIHRSHIINSDFVSRIKKENRQYSVALYGNDYLLPISRSNLSGVLASLEARIQ